MILQNEGVSQVHANPTARWLYAVIGFGFVGIGIIGYILPGLPGTVFLVLALGAFRKSNPVLEQRLLNNRYVGKTLRDWETYRRVPVRIKVISITCIWVFGSATIYRGFQLWHNVAGLITACMLALMVFGTVYILRQKS